MIFDFLKNNPLVKYLYRQCVCISCEIISTWKVKNRVKSNQIKYPLKYLPPQTQSKHSLLGPAKSVCGWVCVLFQGLGVDHPADKEQRPRRFIPDQEEEGAVHSVDQVAWRWGDARVLVPLGGCLHDDLVFDTAERGSLSRDLLQACVR